MTAIVPLRWSLRIDDQGIGRRFLFRWDVWSWADISSGRIEKRHPYTLVDPKCPWWRRKLSLEYMTRADISHTMEVINTYYQLPTAPQVPDILEIKYGAFRRRLARFDSKGVHLQGGRDMRQYLWSEVRRVHVTRMDPLRHDFKSLELVLPDREIELKLVSTQYGTHPSWSGATGEAVDKVSSLRAGRPN